MEEVGPEREPQAHDPRHEVADESIEPADNPDKTTGEPDRGQHEENLWMEFDEDILVGGREDSSEQESEASRHIQACSRMVDRVSNL